MKLALLIALIPALAVAGAPSEGPPTEPPIVITPIVATGGEAHASAGAVAGAAAIAGGGAGGEGGDGGAASAVGEGGAGGAATAEQSQEARAESSNNGNHQGVTINHRRNAPSLAQGGLAASGCGAGANGGGSREGGAGFLGVVWTTDQCYQLLAAASFAAIGMPDTSCDLLVSMKSVQKAFKRAGKPLPDCTSAENRDLVAAAAEVGHGLAAIERMKPAPKCPDCVTRPELDRAFKKSQEK